MFFLVFSRKILRLNESYVHLRGSLAQLVEQRPEEPCVPSSSLGGATKIKVSAERLGLLFLSERNELHRGVMKVGNQKFN